MSDQMPARLSESEVAPLARQLGKAFKSYVDFIEEAYGVSRAEAKERAEFTVEEFARFMKTEPSSMNWITLSQITGRDEQAGMRLWEDMKTEARLEVESGHHAAEVASGCLDIGPYDRARFLAVRQALRDEWNPSRGSESFLIDMLAQIQTCWEVWLRRHLHQFHVGDGDSRTGKEKHLGGWLPNRITEAEALEMSATMIDRWSRMYLRTLRGLRDLRRLAPQVIVQNAGQVNVAEKQVNVQEAGGLQ